MSFQQIRGADDAVGPLTLVHIWTLFFIHRIHELDRSIDELHGDIAIVIRICVFIQW